MLKFIFAALILFVLGNQNHISIMSHLLDPYQLHKIQINMYYLFYAY